MVKRVFFVHGWGERPDSAWLPWLAGELMTRGYDVTGVVLPHPNEPTIDAWVGRLAEVVGTVDAETAFVGHSIGCQTIMRFLAAQDAQAERCLLVAPWFDLVPGSLADAASEAIAKPWETTPIDLTRFRANAGAIHAVFSDSDPFVPLTDADRFIEELGANVIFERHKGHFDTDSGVVELPSLLTAFN